MGVTILPQAAPRVHHRSCLHTLVKGASGVHPRVAETQAIGALDYTAR